MHNQELEKAYKSIFGEQLNKTDKGRLEFLSTVVEGHVEVNGDRMTLDKVVETYNNNSPMSEASKEARALYMMRKWYEKQTDDNERNAKFYSEKAALVGVTQRFPGCLIVLKTYKLRAAFDGALKYANTLEKEQDKAYIVHLAASTLFGSGLSALKDYAVEKMPDYAKKYRFNKETWQTELIKEPELQHSHK